jgi:major membrane immunogen (membrane-anchored lipoprotein)
MLLLVCCFALNLQAQVTGTISGTVKDKSTQSPLEQAAIIVGDSAYTTSTNAAGEYSITLPTGTYQVQAKRDGYSSDKQFNIIVTSGGVQYVSFELTRAAKLDGLSISAKAAKRNSAVVADLITPLSVQRLTVTEIKNNPGGNFDISRVIQALPGVAGSGGFRNDIIIRGGAPSENVFYLDGIEIPVINHFQTQGSSGGPQGQLNVSFIEDVKLSSSAFDARYDNTLASVFAFKQRNGSSKGYNGNIRLSGTELAATVEGPLFKNTTFLASARRSYLQTLFSLLDLPIRPNYWDFQWKTSTKLNAKTTLTTIGVGAIDEFTTVATRNSTAENEYILRRVPYIDGWNYTNGVALKRLVKDGYYNIALSRNMFSNRNRLWQDKQIGVDSLLVLNINSQEVENKLRFDYNKVSGEWQWSAGASAQYVKFFNNFSNKVTLPFIGDTTFTSNTTLKFWKMGLFAQAGRKFLNNKLGWNFGIRTDMNTFTDDGMNPLQALSPRTSISYAVAPKWQVSASVGQYYRLPSYTLLGFKNNDGSFANEDAKYIRSTHYTAGVEFLPKSSLRFTAEAFYKQYANYPVSVNTGISIANIGTGFVAIGNEDISSVGLGRAYGFELFVQQKLVKKIFTTASYTFVRSQFNGLYNSGAYFASSWDNRHLFSGIVGYKLPRNWEFGAKIRYSGGAPYTPFDSVLSRSNYAINGEGVLDYSRLNSQRLAPFAQFDFRFDKKWNFKAWTFDLFFDMQNASVRGNEQAPTYVFKRKADNSDFETTDGLALKPDGSNGIPVITIDRSAIPTPTLGFIVEW